MCFQIFKKHDLNLIYLESRPSKKNFGEYNFFVDIDKGVQEIAHVLKEIENEDVNVKNLSDEELEKEKIRLIKMLEINENEDI